MGMFDKLSNLFKKSGSSISEHNSSEEYSTSEKSNLVSKIETLIKKIDRINSFDSTIWNLRNISTYELYKKSMKELNQLYSQLNDRLSTVEKQSQSPSSKRETLERIHWTGEKPNDWSKYQLDRSQRDSR